MNLYIGYLIGVNPGVSVKSKLDLLLLADLEYFDLEFLTFYYEFEPLGKVATLCIISSSY